MISIPSDSYLHTWIDQFDNTELWPSWRIATGLGIIGAALGRSTWFPYGRAGVIWPNTSVLLVGKSGDGKDTINAPAGDVLREVGVAYVAGKTMEAVQLSLHRIGDPAVGFIFAGELKEFLGSKDYQAGMLESLTNILSNNKVVDITTKTDLMTGGARQIRNPSLTMFTGSTITWLQKIEGILDSGFLPRFVVAVEMEPKTRFVPNPGQYESLDQRDYIKACEVAFVDQVRHTKERFEANPTKFGEDESGKDFFTNWYINRASYFPPTLEAYAARSGNLMRKVAMLMAVSRGNDYISEVDYQFAAEFMIHGATRLERAVINTSPDVMCSYEIMKLLPSTSSELLRVLSAKFTPVWVKRAISYLVETEQITNEKGKLSKNG